MSLRTPLTPEGEMEELREDNARLRAEVDRLKSVLGTPEVEDFLKAVEREAAYQREHWGKGHDEVKSHANWYWLLGWLGGKAVMDPHEPGDERTPRERRLHRIVTVAAVAFHWHDATRKGEI